jgi:hypothetical protein
MNNNGTLFNAVFAIIAQVEPNWQLKVELNSSALMGSSQGVIYSYVNLWSIKSSVAFIQFPFNSS